MTEQQINRVVSALEGLDEGSAGIAWSSGKAAPRPALVIGLGGMGISAMLKVRRKLKDLVDPGCADAAVPRHISFLGIDTDQYSARLFEDEMGTGAAGSDFIFCGMRSLTAELSDGFSREEYNWMPPAFKDFLKNNPGRLMSDNGSGAIRGIGRLALLHNRDLARTAIETKLNYIVKEQPHGGPAETDVYILSGLCGGTGSGMLIDLPAIIRDESERIFGYRPLNIMGILFLPDVSLIHTGAAANPNLRIMHEANAYEAIKELDDLNFCEDKGESLAERVRAERGLHVGAARRLYDHILPVSAKDENGMPAIGAPRKIYDVTLERAAGLVVDFLLDVNALGLELRSFLSNTEALHAQFTGMLQQQGNLRPVNYRYLAFGASEASFPEGRVILNLMRRGFAECAWDREAEKKDVELCLHEIGIEGGILQRELTGDMQGRIMNELLRISGYNPGNAQSYFALVQSLTDHLMGQLTGRIRQQAQEMKNRLSERVHSRRNILYTFFAERERGPVYTARCIISSDKMCMCGYLKHQEEMAQNKISEMTSRLGAMHQRLSQLQGEYGGGLFILRRRRWEEEYLEVLHQMIMTELYCNVVLPEIRELLRQAIYELQKVHAEFFEPAANLTERMMQAISENPAAGAAAAADEAGGADDYSVQIVRPQLTDTAVSDFLAADAAGRERVMRFPEALYSFILENFEDWGKERERRADQEIVRMAGEYFIHIMNLDGSIDRWTDFVTGGSTAFCDQIYDQLLQELFAKSRVKFPMAAQPGREAEPYPEAAFVSVGTDSPYLIRFSNGIAGLNLTGIPRNSVRNRIFMTRLRLFVPIEDYALFKEMEEAYRRSAATAVDR